MSSHERWTGETPGTVLEGALREFRMSVHAWSEAAYSRPRTAAPAARHRNWRLAAGWALGCVLAAGSLAGEVYEHHQRQELARMAAARRAEQQRMAAERLRTRQEDTNLLATVDSDVSQAVPEAMEPLAQLMDDGGTQ
jgi:hypothetical protein